MRVFKSDLSGDSIHVVLHSSYIRYIIVSTKILPQKSKSDTTGDCATAGRGRKHRDRAAFVSGTLQGIKP